MYCMFIMEFKILIQIEMNSSLFISSFQVPLLVVILVNTKHVGTEGPNGGNFLACRARTGCYIYDKVPCLIGPDVLPVNQCYTCIECQGNTGNCDTLGIADRTCEAAGTCDDNIGCDAAGWTADDCKGCPFGETSPTYQAESCKMNKLIQIEMNSDLFIS